MRKFEEELKGGHPNSLGNTIKVVQEVLEDHHLFDALFNCYFSTDEVVRLRTSNAMKRIAQEQKLLLVPYIDQLLTKVAVIQQASAQWTLAQLFDVLEKELSVEQKEQAKNVLKKNLAQHQDWIVLNQTMATLTKWAIKDDVLMEWMLAHLKRLSTDERKSVARRAEKMLLRLKK